MQAIPMTLRGAEKPVSYTHLDVYKRQVDGLTAQLKAISAQPITLEQKK